MTTCCYKPTWMLAFVGLLMALAVPLGSGRVAAQGLTQTVFEAPLMLHLDGQSVRKGTVLATLDGQDLRLFGAFDGLRTPWVQADLYRGDPGNGGTFVENLAILFANPSASALGGGFDRTVTLTPEQVDDLNNGVLYIAIFAATADPNDALHGQIQLAPAAEPGLMEAPLSHLWQGLPVSRGSVRALRTSSGLRLIGFFHGLASNWQRIGLYRGAHGAEKEQVASLFNVGGSGLYAGFDQTFALDEGWEQDLHDGLFSIEVHTGPSGDGLRGHIRPTANQAPAASAVLTPDDGETLVIGGTDGAVPVDPGVLLGTVSLAAVDDPDDDPVAYLWQASLRPDFLSAEQTITHELGVDSTRLHLTVASAAALFDALSGRQPGTILLNTPVTVYHRVLTTDGARYTVGSAVQATFIRGTITATEAEGGLPDAFTLHGNYPNPFNPSTTIVFDLPAQAEVRVDVFNLLGQRVLAVPAGILPSGASQRVEVDAARLSSGSYLYRVVIAGGNTAQVATGTMLLVK